MLEYLRTRRSIRKYKSQPVENDTIEQLKEAILRSPSSRGINPWEFIFTLDTKIIQKLSMAKRHGSEFLAGAPLAIVILGDETKSDVWIEDCSIASIVVQLAAHALGLGSCWVQIRNRQHSAEISSEKFVRDLLLIPDHMRVLSIIGIGYPDEQSEPVLKENLQYKKIYHNTYAQQ